jgi:hypothetical protein
VRRLILLKQRAVLFETFAPRYLGSYGNRNFQTGARVTTRVTAMNREGQMRRLFPVPCRLLEGSAQFKKWEWTTARLAKPTKDQRPESRRLDTDSISCSRNVITTTGGDWRERLRWIEPHIVESFAALESHGQIGGQTLGFLRSAKRVELRITPVKQTDWAEADRIKLKSLYGIFLTANGGLVSGHGKNDYMNSMGHWFLGWNTRDEPNGIYDICMEVNAGDESYFSETNTTIVSSMVSFDPFPIYGSQMWIHAQLAVAARGLESRNYSMTRTVMLDILMGQRPAGSSVLSGNLRI